MTTRIDQQHKKNRFFVSLSSETEECQLYIILQKHQLTKPMWVGDHVQDSMRIDSAWCGYKQQQFGDDVLALIVSQYNGVSVKVFRS